MSEGRARRSSIVIKTSLIMIDVFQTQLSNSPNYSHEYRHIDPLISISTAIEKAVSSRNLLKSDTIDAKNSDKDIFFRYIIIRSIKLSQLQYL